MNPRPPRPIIPAGWWTLFVAASAALLASLALVGADPRMLFDHNVFSSLGDLGRALPRPNLSKPYLYETIRPVTETIRIATTGTALALLLGLPLAFPASTILTFDLALRGGDKPPNTIQHLLRRTVWLCTRFFLNLLRSIPELVWALIFVRALGLGPTPGILAIAVVYAGVIGKVYAEIFEGTDLRPARALRATGVSLPVVVIWSILPQALPTLLSYGLYRWECAMRAATILGFVGAGGLGQHIEISMRMFDHARTATLLLELFTLVLLTEALSAFLRRRIR